MILPLLRSGDPQTADSSFSRARHEYVRDHPKAADRAAAQLTKRLDEAKAALEPTIETWKRLP